MQDRSYLVNQDGELANHAFTQACGRVFLSVAPSLRAERNFASVCTVVWKFKKLGGFLGEKVTVSAHKALPDFNII